MCTHTTYYNNYCFCFQRETQFKITSAYLTVDTLKLLLIRSLLLLWWLLRLCKRSHSTFHSSYYFSPSSSASSDSWGSFFQKEWRWEKNLSYPQGDQRSSTWLGFFFGTSCSKLSSDSFFFFWRRNWPAKKRWLIKSDCFLTFCSARYIIHVYI